MKSMHLRSILCLTAALVSCATQPPSTQSTATPSVAPPTTAGTLVHDVAAFDAAVRDAKPGAVIVLANGDWRDAELGLFARGTAEAPITLTVETKGKVRLVGRSNLRLAGEHLVAEGLVFTKGHSPTGELISFARKDGVYANHSRVTECVVDGFNAPERMGSEIWLALYGKHNRVDHSVFTNKRTRGVTMAVRMVDEASRENEHRIDHNYFGPRQTLGNNGGETLRVGTSHYSLETSGTVVEENYFDQVDGELEIISSKSCGNQFIGNTFFESRGTLTFRHGNDSVARDNFFFGNGKRHTGGIRIINERNQAINNYFYGLTGYFLRGALVIMNGVPNSPPNRYFQVVGGVFSQNTFVNADHILLGAGADAERSLPPKDSKIENNLFYHDERDTIFSVFDNMDGIAFANNFVGGKSAPLQKQGFVQLDPKLQKNAHGVYVPTHPDVKGAGCSLEQPKATRANTGASWYQPRDESIVFESGRTVVVQPGVDSLARAVADSQSGDILQLEPGEYSELKSISIRHPLSIVAKGAKPLLRPARTSLFIIENGGSLKLKGLRFTGEDAADMNGNTMLRTSTSPMNRNYELIVEDCEARDMVVNHSFDFFRAGEHTFADKIHFKNSTFENISGHVIALDKDREDLGSYNAEYVTIEGCSFKDVKHSALTLRRGGTDESTFGPMLWLKDSRFDNVGSGKRNETEAAVYVHGVQIVDVRDSQFRGGKGLRVHLTNGQPVTGIENCSFEDSKGITYNRKEFEATGIRYDGRKVSKARL